MGAKGSTGRLWGTLSAGVLALTVAGCNFTPDYKRPDMDLPSAYRNPLPDPSPEMPRPLSEWWTSLGSVELNSLVEQALANNRDLKAATHRILQAEAQAGSTASALLPTASIVASRSLDSPQGGQGTLITGNTNRTHRLWAAGLSVSWEIDLWGKIRAGESNALATALANVHDREALAVTLVSEVVTAYLQFLESQDREDVARQNIANMKTMHAAVRERVRLGESSELELAQQRNVLAQGEASLPPLAMTRERSFNKLAALLGKTPAELSLKGKSLSELTIPEVSPGLPSDLLLRRPDIKKAEANLVAANFNIGVARSKLFPALSMTGTRGWASQLYDNFTSPASIYWTLAGTVTTTLFDNGKNQADIDYAKERFSELAETYQQTILNAMRDAEDALVTIRLQGDLEVAQREVLEASLAAWRLSSEAFRLGMVDYLNVLETQRTRFQAEDANVQARSGRLVAIVALYKALGGGMERPETPKEEEGGGQENKSTQAPPPAPPQGQDTSSLPTSAATQVPDPEVKALQAAPVPTRNQAVVIDSAAN